MTDPHTHGADTEQLDHLRDLLDQAELNAELARRASLDAVAEVIEAQERLQRIAEAEQAAYLIRDQARSMLHAEMRVRGMVRTADGFKAATQ